MLDVRQASEAWKQKTFAATVRGPRSVSSAVSRASLKCFKDIGIAKKVVDGYACEKLPKTEEGNIGVDINYSDVFHRLSKRKQFSPVNYLTELVRLFLQKGGERKRLDGFISRGVRTLTSLIREPDFAGNIVQYLKKFDSSVAVSSNPRQDAGDHTDVLLTFKRKIYRIWLFQFSDRGLPHDIERITGRRGELPSGIHVLCPLPTEVAIAYDKARKREERIKIQTEKTFKRLRKLSKKAKIGRKKLVERIEKLKEDMSNNAVLLTERKKKADPYLDVLNGWYFYSKPHVERIGEQIRLGKKIYDYKTVVKTLLTPEVFLGKTRVFRK